MSTTMVTESRRLAEQKRLDGERTSNERNRAGQFATPPAMATEIAETTFAFLSGDEPVRFLEPCVGSGAFFSAVLGVCSDRQLVRAVGVERDESVAEVARELWTEFGLDVIHADFTTLPARERFNLLVTNPPYVRHHHLDENAKRHLRSACQCSVGIRPNGLAGLHVYFPLLADRWLDDGGLACWLIPSEFMDVNYGSALLGYLRDQVDLQLIHKYPTSDTQFDAALVSSAVVIYRKCPPTGVSVKFTAGRSIRTPESIRLVDRTDLQDGKWGRLFSTSEQLRRSKPEVTLGDLFHIRRGLATGNNEFFILPRSDAVRRQLPLQFCRPILPGSKTIVGDTIEADADGFPKVDPQLVLIDCPLSESEVREQFPTLWEYIHEGMKNGVHETYLTSRRTPWYSQEDRPAPPFLCPYMGRRTETKDPFRFIRNRSRATAHNVYLLLYPKGPLALAIRNRPELLETIFDALRHVEIDRLLTEGRVYGGGLHKAEPKELGRLSADTILSAIPEVQPREATLFDLAE